jgi:hypothetical protein
VKPGRHRPLARVALAIGGVAVVLSACSSDPSAKRVAEDLINTLATTDAEKQCMLDVLDGYSTKELEDLGNAVNEGNDADKAAAQEQLNQFQARLTACR